MWLSRFRIGDIVTLKPKHMYARAVTGGYVEPCNRKMVVTEVDNQLNLVHVSPPFETYVYTHYGILQDTIKNKYLGTSILKKVNIPFDDNLFWL